MKDESHPLTDMNLVEIYAASTDLEADRVVMLLGDEEIEAYKREQSVTAIPVEAGHRFIIVVFEDHKDRALEVLEQARKDEVLPAGGTFLAS